MREHKYLVLGTGVGRAIAYWLLKQPKTKKVTLADIAWSRTQSAVESIAPDYVKTERCMPMYFNADQMIDSEIRRLFEGYSVVVSAIPAKYNPRLSWLSIQAHTHFCDLGGVISVTEEMFELNKIAYQSGISVIPDCGLMPGLGNIMATDLWELMGADDITIYVGGIPQHPQPPHYYQQTFSLEGLLHILDPSPVLRQGKILNAAPYSERELLHVKNLERYGSNSEGIVEAFVTAGAGTAAYWFRTLGVRNFSEKTIRWPGFLDYVKSIPREKILETFRRELPPTDSNHPDLILMRVVADNGKKRATWELLDAFDLDTGLSAMARTTGFSAAAVACLAADNLTAPGVKPPESAIGPEERQRYLDLVKSDLDIRLEYK